jgi:hypothetical protein
MMNKRTLQNTETRKKEYQKADGLVRPETVFLSSKDHRLTYQDNLPNIHSRTECRFSVLFALKSEKK